ncbi:hypothetical protein A2U01_0096830, partial [Trifolium medium]|nr:hypothetical protein [Trifolium medium]
MVSLLLTQFDMYPILENRSLVVKPLIEKNLLEWQNCKAQEL